MGRLDQASFDHLDHGSLQGRFALEFECRRKSPECAKDSFGVCGGPDLRLGIDHVSRLRAAKENYSATDFAEVREDGFVNVIECADDAEHGCRIDAFAQSLVIEADVAASD